MGTVIELRSREVVDMDHVAALLDRLEWRLDEPCSVVGCSHDGGSCVTDGEPVLPEAA